MFSAPRKGRKEFQAVVLAGHGASLYPLSEKENMCKALLPIGNEPMISYVLTWLEQAGIIDVLILTPASYYSALSHHLQSFRQSQIQNGDGAMKINLQAVKGSAAGSEGESDDDDDEVLKGKTADLLREYKDSLSTDFIVLPCDFIPPPNLLLSTVLDSHRTRQNATLTTLFYERADVGKEGPDRILVGLDKHTNTLLHVQDIEDMDDDIPIRMSMMWKYPNVTLTTKLLDSHVYVFKHSVLELLKVSPQIESIRDELVPWLLKAGFQTCLALDWKTTLNPSPDPQTLAYLHSTSHLPPSISHASTIPAPSLHSHLPLTLLPSSSHESHPSTTNSSETNLSSIPPSPIHPRGFVVPGGARPNLSRSETVLIRGVGRMGLEDGAYGEEGDLEEEGEDGTERRVACGVVVHRLEDGFVARANTVATYFELNRQFLKQHALSQASLLLTAPPPTPPSPTAPAPLIDPRAQISADSLVGASTRVGERTSVKKSLVGRHCVIGKNVKLVGCVVMDFVRVGDGVKLENCIVCQRATIEDRADLKDCEVGGQFEVLADPGGKTIKGEKLALV
ncbi:nucleotide-diphospho-sugar transferase [Mrakia frigida]|uniref:translation initiation factor eIF2B subunit gamma n=1 Tax=Mrakia frigida TaxID=29902 RepID=UPI003FCC0CB0